MRPRRGFQHRELITAERDDYYVALRCLLLCLVLSSWPMIDLPSMTAVLLVVDLTIRGGLALRVVMRRLPVGVTLAWLLTLLAFPIAGSCCMC